MIDFTSVFFKSLLNLKLGWRFTLIFVNFDFEIAVDQQTRARDQNFKGVPDSGCPPVSAGQLRPYLDNFWLNFVKSPSHAQTHALGAILVATSLLNTYIKFYQNWIKID